MFASRVHELGKDLANAEPGKADIITFGLLKESSILEKVGSPMCARCVTFHIPKRGLQICFNSADMPQIVFNQHIRQSARFILEPGTTQKTTKWASASNEVQNQCPNQTTKTGLSVHSVWMSQTVDGWTSFDARAIDQI